MRVVDQAQHGSAVGELGEHGEYCEADEHAIAGVGRGEPESPAQGASLRRGEGVDPVRRRALIDELWTDDARYVDPIATAEGRAAVDDVVATAQQQFPDLVHRLAGSVDSHHHVTRLTWELAPVGGSPVINGLAVLITERAHLCRVYGFLDPPGAAR